MEDADEGSDHGLPVDLTPFSRAEGWARTQEGHPVRCRSETWAFVIPDHRYDERHLPLRTTWVRRGNQWQQLERRVQWDRLENPHGIINPAAERSIAIFEPLDEAARGGPASSSLAPRGAGDIRYPQLRDESSIPRGSGDIAFPDNISEDYDDVHSPESSEGEGKLTEPDAKKARLDVDAVFNIMATVRDQGPRNEALWTGNSGGKKSDRKIEQPSRPPGRWSGTAGSATRASRCSAWKTPMKRDGP